MLPYRNAESRNTSLVASVSTPVDLGRNQVALQDVFALTDIENIHPREPLNIYDFEDTPDSPEGYAYQERCAIVSSRAFWWDEKVSFANAHSLGHDSEVRLCIPIIDESEYIGNENGGLDFEIVSSRILQSAGTEFQDLSRFPGPQYNGVILGILSLTLLSSDSDYSSKVLGLTKREMVGRLEQMLLYHAKNLGAVMARDFGRVE